MISRILLFISFFLPKIILAQILNFQPGFMVNGKDTITTLINRDSEAAMSLSITIKTPDKVQSYLASEITSFGFKTDRINFEAVEVNVILPESTVSDTRFAKLLVRGEVSLFKLPLEELNARLHPENDYIYIIKKNGVFYPLVQYEDPRGTSFTLQKRYIGMLTALLGDCGELKESDFHNQKFFDKEMIKLVNRYNQCTAPDKQSTIVDYKVKPLIKKSIELSYSKIIPADKDAITASKAFSIGYFWNILRPDVSTRHSLLAGASYMNLNYDYNHSFDINPDITSNTEHFFRFKLMDEFNIGRLNQKVIPFTNFGGTFGLAKNQLLGDFRATVFLGIGGGMHVGKFKITGLCEVDGIKLKESNELVSFSLAYQLNKKSKF